MCCRDVPGSCAPPRGSQVDLDGLGTMRCKVPIPAAAGLLGTLLLVNNAVGFQVSITRQQRQLVASQSTRAAPSTAATRSFVPMMSQEGEGMEEKQRSGLVDRIKKGLSKDWTRALFGMGTAFGAGFAVPEASNTLKAVRDGKDVSTVLSEALRPPSAEAISLKSYSRRSLKEKLASVPCFMVTNRAGNPYLVPLDSGYDVGVVFLDPQDAEEMMQNMIQNPATSDARVMVMGLDKGLKLVQQEPRGQGGHAVLFQFCPSVQQLQNANGFRKMGWKAILNKSQDKWRWGFNRQGVKNAGIPIFYCPELRIVKGRELIKTFFFSMEDLYYAWDKANHGQGGEKPEVVTLDLLRTLEWMMNEPQEARGVGFHADTQAQEFVEQGLKIKGGRVKVRRG